MSQPEGLKGRNKRLKTEKITLWVTIPNLSNIHTLSATGMKWSNHLPFSRCTTEIQLRHTMRSMQHFKQVMFLRSLKYNPGFYGNRTMLQLLCKLGGEKRKFVFFQSFQLLYFITQSDEYLLTAANFTLYAQ